LKAFTRRLQNDIYNLTKSKRILPIKYEIAEYLTGCSKMAKKIINRGVFRPFTDDQNCQTDLSMRKAPIGYLENVYEFETDKIFRNVF
jgi:hypothetical protein